MKSLFCFILLIISSIPGIRAQNPDFVKEDLTFILSDSSFTVSGYYYFLNTNDEIKIFNLLYPFPVNKDYGKISDVYAYIDGNPFKNGLLRYNDKAAFIRLEIAAKKPLMIRIGYSQKLNSNKAEYILTSTQSWGKPLKEVNYTLIVPENFNLDSLSYEPDFKHSKNGKNIYYYHKENFMPYREFEIYFGR